MGVKIAILSLLPFLSNSNEYKIPACNLPLVILCQLIKMTF